MKKKKGTGKKANYFFLFTSLASFFLFPSFCLAEMRMRLPSQYVAVYKARQLIPIELLTERTTTVVVSVRVGVLVYTLDGTNPVLLDGVLHLKVGECVTLNLKEARLFKGMPAMDGTRVQVLLFE